MANLAVRVNMEGAMNSDKYRKGVEIRPILGKYRLRDRNHSLERLEEFSCLRFHRQ